MEPKVENDRIAFIQAGWHADIVDEGRNAFLAELPKLGIAVDRVDVCEVPGSLEIPLRSKQLAKSGRYAAIVAAGLVVDGGIYRHEFVAETVIDGLMRVQLETEVPILSLVLTPHSFHEHEAHRGFFQRHFELKGREAAAACVSVINSPATPKGAYAA